jgi:splicing factor U2AF subunit
MTDYSRDLFTERDKINCAFFYRVGACKHGQFCKKRHYIPQSSRIVILRNLYKKPLLVLQSVRQTRSQHQLQAEFDELYEELFIELEENYGPVQELKICENMVEHLAGNVYVKFRHEEDAGLCCKQLNNRWFDGSPIYAELCPITDLRNAMCRGTCERGDYFCGYLHIKPISRDLNHKLYVNPQHNIRLVQLFFVANRKFALFSLCTNKSQN